MSGALTFGIQTRHGTSLVPLVERELSALIPPGVIYTYHALAPVTAKADRSLRPISIALGVFGAVTLAGRDPRRRPARGAPFPDRSGGPRSTAGIGCQSGRHHARRPHRCGGCDPLGGFPRRRDRGPAVSHCSARSRTCGLSVYGLRIRLDRPGLRDACALRRVDGIAVLLALRLHRTACFASAASIRLRRTSSRWLPVQDCRRPAWSACAWRSSRARAVLPSRSARRSSGPSWLLPLVVTTVMFGSSLQTLVSSPALYGWNWSYVLNPIGSGGGNVPQVALTCCAAIPTSLRTAGPPTTTWRSTARRCRS